MQVADKKPEDKVMKMSSDCDFRNLCIQSCQKDFVRTVARAMTVIKGIIHPKMTAKGAF